jgi:thioredoxin reductase
VESVEPGLQKPLMLICNQKGQESSWEADLVLCALGRLPEKRFYSYALLQSEAELISQGRLHLVGDVRNDRYRQVSIAIGNGIEAAMKIYDQRGRGL